MPRAPSPRRYAQAVFQIAVERDELDSWREDLEVLTAALEDNDFSTLLDAPQVHSELKLNAARETLSKAVGPLALNLLSILALRGLVHLVPGILDEFGRLLDAHHGIERAEVASAVQLDREQQSKVSKLLEGIVGNEVRLTSVLEPEVLGGLVARVGDRLIDGSTRSKLRGMHRSIVEQTS